MLNSTPGPWHKSFDKWGDVTVRDYSGYNICTLAGNVNDDSNARLIVAAPDLLAALEAIASAESSALELAYCKGVARAAIAAAKGQA